jgi:hypothetical protein
MKTITETKELYVAAISLIVRYKAAEADDGKVSALEWLGFVAELGKVKAAVTGITEVPKELIDLDEEELEEIQELTKLALVRSGFTHRLGDVTGAILEAADKLIDTVVTIQGLPPSAVAVKS